MILAGTNIQSPGDMMKKVTIEYLYHSIRNPKQDIEAHIRQLRIVRGLDKKQYSALKRRLPYVVTGVFNPPIRRTENFAYIEYFVLDIDHISEKEYEISDVRRRVQADSRVMLSFLSPSQDGLKILFRLKQRCYDSGIFSLFYKSFLKNFSEQYQLEQVVDSKTCDVTRACFVSIDADAYYNPNAECVNLEDFVNVDNPESMFLLGKQLDASSDTKTHEEDHQAREKEPEADVMSQIKQMLGAKRQKKETLSAEVPSPVQIDALMPGLKEYIEENGLTLVATKGIQYGKKLQLVLGLKKAEINIFYGKRGYSVVQSPKCGTSAELNQIACELIQFYINENV